MKSKFLFVVLTLLLSASFVHSQEADSLKKSRKKPKEKPYNFLWDKEPRKHLLKINIPSAFAQVGNLSYEVIIKKRVGIQIGGLAGSYFISRTENKLYGGMFETKVYFKNNAPRAFYASLNFRYRYLDSESIEFLDDELYKIYNLNVQSYSLGLNLGRQWVLGNWFAVNPFVGAVYNLHQFNYGPDATKDKFNLTWLGLTPWTFRWGVQIGMAFK